MNYKLFCELPLTTLLSELALLRSSCQGKVKPVGSRTASRNCNNKNHAELAVMLVGSNHHHCRTDT